ncbi:Uncharacterised protein [Vibrio cholerae]|nr:Uncharacterised protein [Vibrio cholerae]
MSRRQFGSLHILPTLTCRQPSSIDHFPQRLALGTQKYIRAFTVRHFKKHR